MSKTETQSDALRLASKLRGEAERSIVKYSTAHQSAKELERLDAENKALRADAERYRWLAVQHWVEPEAKFRLGLKDVEYINTYMSELDTAIDAALAAAKNGGSA